MAIHVYGIPNCDTVKKARRWLETQGVDYVFHDFKKEGITQERLAKWADQVGWETLLNRKGTTWRQLPDSAKDGVDRVKAQEIMEKNTSVIKRPVVESGDRIVIGFDEDNFSRLAKSSF